MKRKFYSGCPIKVRRGLYWHHGIYVGNGWVIHYSGPDNSMTNATIRYVTLREFADGGEIVINEALAKRAIYQPDEVVARAMSRLNENRFNLMFNNCEHFTNWCVSGQSESPQVQMAVGVTIFAVLAFAASRA